MEYTKNYHLPQWVKSDRIMMEDFNGAMAGIEAGITGNAQAAARAQAAADNAGIAANNAQSTANTALANKPYVIGTYRGNLREVEVKLGFRPQAIVIARSYINYDEETDPLRSMGECILFIDGINNTFVDFRDDGFYVGPYRQAYPSVNWNYTDFVYIAFR